MEKNRLAMNVILIIKLRQSNVYNENSYNLYTEPRHRQRERNDIDVGMYRFNNLKFMLC